MRLALKDGSCAIGGCEPCQVGDQAALSGFPNVPRGCLSGVGGTVSVCRGLFDSLVYGLIRALELFCGLLRATAAEPAFFRREEPYVSRFVPQMAPGRF